MTSHVEQWYCNVELWHYNVELWHCNVELMVGQPHSRLYGQRRTKGPYITMGSIWRYGIGPSVCLFIGLVIMYSEVNGDCECNVYQAYLNVDLGYF